MNAIGPPESQCPIAYRQLIQRLLTVNLAGGVKLGLQNVQRLQQLWQYPDRTFDSIHVAGTNGKGSVCIKIAHALENAGYRVGLYTSPHLSCFRERIRVNGEMIAEEAVEAILPDLFQTIREAQIPATFFEITTLLAFLHFARQNVDIAVLETGLGGRLDATNVVNPCLTIITSISLDHTEILGSTCEEIAHEKGGIIKEKVPVIIGPHVPLDPIKTIADQKKSRWLQVTPASHLYEVENQSIARAALHELASRFDIAPEAIEKGLAARQPCRFEILEGAPLIILDVAHNPDGILHLFQSCAHHFPGRSLRLLCGLSKSKDIKECLKCTVCYGSHFHLVEASNGRGASIEKLHEQLLELSMPDGRISLHRSIAEGVQIARKEAFTHNQILVVFGTFFIMGEVRRALGYQDPSDDFDLNERSLEKSCQDKQAGL